MDAGDVGGLVGGITAGGLTAKLIVDGIATAALGPAYLIGSTLAGYYLGHYIGHELAGSKSH